MCIYQSICERLCSPERIVLSKNISILSSQPFSGEMIGRKERDPHTLTLYCGLYHTYTYIYIDLFLMNRMLSREEISLLEESEQI